MTRKLAGNFASTQEAEREINDLLTAGFTKEQITVVTEHISEPTIQEEGIDVEIKSDNIKDESLWDKIKRQFTGDEPENYDLNGLIEPYREDLRQGHLLVFVDSDDDSQKGRDFAERSGFYDDAAADQDTSADLSRTAGLNARADLNTDQRDRDQADESDHTIELHEEKLDVETNRVKSGEVTIEKKVVEETQTIEVPVKHEEVVVKHHSVDNREISDGEAFHEEDITIPIMEEKVEVKKTPVVTEEISIEKNEKQENREITEQVRKEELEVNKSGDIKEEKNLFD